jgi:hypothetical protein
VLLDEVVEDALVDADTEHVWVEVGGEDELHAAERATRCVCVCVCVCVCSRRRSTYCVMRCEGVSGRVWDTAKERGGRMAQVGSKTHVGPSTLETGLGNFETHQRV